MLAALPAGGWMLVHKLSRVWGRLRSVSWLWACTSVGQWGLIIGVTGPLIWLWIEITRVIRHPAVKGLDADTGARLTAELMLGGSILLAFLTPLCAWLALRRARSWPRVFARRRRTLIQRGWLLVIAMAALAFLYAIPGYTFTGVLAIVYLLVLFVVAGIWGWTIGLTWQVRSRLFWSGLIPLVFFALFGMRAGGIVQDTVRQWLGLTAWPDASVRAITVDLDWMMYLLWGFFGVALWIIVTAERATPGHLPPPASSRTGPSAAPPAPELPRSPTTGMVRRQLDV